MVERMRAEAHIGSGPHPPKGDVTELDDANVRT
jgi:cytochrome c oxidase subunit 1